MRHSLEQELVSRHKPGAQAFMASIYAMLTTAQLAQIWWAHCRRYPRQASKLRF